MKKAIIAAGFGLMGLVASSSVSAACPYASGQVMVDAINTVIGAGDPALNGGFGNQVWVVFTGADGAVCQVINSRSDGGIGGMTDQFNTSVFASETWQASRAIAATKAYTAFSLSTKDYAISTANLYTAVQGGSALAGAGTSTTTPAELSNLGSLNGGGGFNGLSAANPVDTTQIYKLPYSGWGNGLDPMIGELVGGVNTFGGGLALYSGGEKLGAIGVSGDTSCTDHVVAWKIRAAMMLDVVPTGPAKTAYDTAGTVVNLAMVESGGMFAAKGDEMMMENKQGYILASAGTGKDVSLAAGWVHPSCPNTPKYPDNTTATDDGDAILFFQYPTMAAPADEEL